jgi:membrane fusion protein (multidrug efflux system)
MQADILMQSAPRSRLWLPLAAIQEDENGRYVFINDEGKAARRAIGTGEIRADHIEIVDGLEAGTQVVITGFNGLNEGKKLKIEN